MITLNQHIEQLQNLIKDNPKLKDLPIVYSSDDEGNHFQYVNFKASAGCFIKKDQDYMTEIEIYGDGVTPEDNSRLAINCTCIN